MVIFRQRTMTKSGKHCFPKSEETIWHRYRQITMTKRFSKSEETIFVLISVRYRRTKIVRQNYSTDKRWSKLVDIDIFGHKKFYKATFLYSITRGSLADPVIHGLWSSSSEMHDLGNTPTKIHGLRTLRQKYTIAGALSEEKYDLRKNPSEIHNLRNPLIRYSRQRNYAVIFVKNTLSRKTFNPSSLLPCVKFRVY